MTSPRPLPGGWRWAALGEVCEINPRRPRNLPAAPDEPVTFIPMSAVDEGASAVTQPQERPLAEVTRGYTYMEDGDVIFAKITPCMQNGKHAIVGDTLTGFAFGSTEFHVLRPGDAIHPVWVHRFLLQPSVLREAQQHFTGTAGQQRVPKQYLIEKLIPLPPIEEQRRIVADLEARMEAAGRARSAAEAQLAAVLALPAALLREAFTSRADRQRRAQGARLWRSARLGDVCDIIRGVTFERGDVSRVEKDGYIPILRAGNIKRILDTEHDVIWVPEHYVSAEQLLRKDDITICMSSGSPSIVGKTAQLMSEWFGSVGAFCGIVRAGNAALARYMGLWFQSEQFARWRDGQTRGVSIQNLRTSRLADLSIPLPPLDEQRRIVADLEARMAGAELAWQAAEAQLAAAESLPSAILRVAFAGEAA